MSNLLSGNAYEPDKEILKISTDELEQTYHSTSSKSLTTALVNYLENNSILNLTFKHNFNKVSINFAATDTKLGKAKVELLQASDQNYAKNVLPNENLFENNKNLDLRDIKAEVVEITEINSGENKALVNHLLAKGTQLINTFRLQSDVAKLTANPISGLKQSDMNLEDVPSFKAVENSLHYKISEIEKTLKTAPVEKNQKINSDVEVTSKSTEPSNSVNNVFNANPKSAAALTNIEGSVNYKFQNLDASISKKLDAQNLAAQNVNITSDEIFQELNLEKIEINGESAKTLKTSDSKAASDVKTPIELKTEASVNDAIKISMNKSGDADEGKVTLTAKEINTSNTILESTKGFQEVENVIVKTKSRIIAENIKIENSSLVNESRKVSDEKNVTGDDKVHSNKKIVDGDLELSAKKDQNENNAVNKELTGLASKEIAELKFKSEIVNLPVDFKSVKKADVSESVKATNSEKESINAKVELSASENSSSSEGSTSFGGDKEMAKQNGHELNKSSISHAPSFINDLEGERLKVFSELKQMHESFKVIKPAELFNEIGKMINGAEKQSLTFQLNPENLGKIKLMVDFIDNQLVTRIEVENEQVKHFIQSNIETLKQQLTSSGIQLSNVSVSLADYDQKNNKPFAPKKKSSSRVVNENSDEDILKSE
ncbi:MAG: flagellar hook-length control protein FliK, partial [Ignavibacteria bacterium]|nr:flagellar hook-length control protein FliK [Ignavibacteria bacterium]